MDPWDARVDQRAALKAQRRETQDVWSRIASISHVCMSERVSASRP